MSHNKAVNLHLSRPPAPAKRAREELANSNLLCTCMHARVRSILVRCLALKPVLEFHEFCVVQIGYSNFFCEVIKV